jgi:hypothetical protein
VGSVSYDATYEALARRATDSAVVDVEAFIKRMLSAGYQEDRLRDMLLSDLATSGPIFGKFFRGLETAATQATKEAFNAGATAGELIATDEEVAAMVDRFDLADRLADGDPEALDEVEYAGDLKTFMWVAALKNTCHRCLPLHGKINTLSNWKTGRTPDGLPTVPVLIHEDWGSKCQCRLVLADNMSVGANTMAPLVRNTDVMGERGGRKTIRGVTGQDIEKAQRAVTKAMDTEEGRAILRMLGQSQGE